MLYDQGWTGFDKPQDCADNARGRLTLLSVGPAEIWLARIWRRLQLDGGLGNHNMPESLRCRGRGAGWH